MLGLMGKTSACGTGIRYPGRRPRLLMGHLPKIPGHVTEEILRSNTSAILRCDRPLSSRRSSPHGRSPPQQVEGCGYFSAKVLPTTAAPKNPKNPCETPPVPHPRAPPLPSLGQFLNPPPN